MDQEDRIKPEDRMPGFPRPLREPVKITPIEVVLTRGFWLGKYEVTRSEWKQVMAIEPWKVKEDTDAGDDVPATWITWDNAMEFCRKLTERERKAGRLPSGWEYSLPTDAQWEFATAGQEPKPNSVSVTVDRQNQPVRVV